MSLCRLLTAAALAFTLSTEASAQDSFASQREWMDVEVGTSDIKKSTRPILRVALSNEEVASVSLISEGQVRVLGKSVGTTDLWIWYRDDPERPQVYEVVVHRDLSEVIRRVSDIAGTAAPPRIYPAQERIVVEGPVPDVQTLERIAALVSVYDEDFINLMTVTGDHQVQLEVVFAEVSRTAVREMGVDYILQTAGSSGVEVTNAFATQNLGWVLQNVTSIGGFGSINGFGLLGGLGGGSSPVNMIALLEVLEEHNITKILAQPTLVALSGQQAEFLAGGEIPIPVAQNNNRITLEFKEYGVKVVFVPTVLAGDVIDLRAYVEVSEVDETTTTRITGIEIPGFLVRKADSHMRIDSGMTFAMAGLLSDTVRYSRAQVPVLGDLPLIGVLFSNTSHRREETELVIFVTPRLVRPLAPEDVPPPPGALEDNNPNDFELFLLGMDYRAGSRTWTPSGPVGAQR